LPADQEPGWVTNVAVALKFRASGRKRACRTVEAEGLLPAQARRNLSQKQTKKRKEQRMKVNQWTVSLAALGLISIPAASWADENDKMNQVWTALSSTTIKGNVSTSMHWDLGTGNGSVPTYAFNKGKQDGFNLNVAKITLEKPLDEAQWAAGYTVDLIYGPDATAFATSLDSAGDASSAGLKQAYVALRAPVGNGLDFKVGVWDTIIGYESFDAGNNPNYSRSYGYTVEPTTHTGVLMSYQVNKGVSLSAGIANTHGPAINERANPPKAESYKTYMASVALTAPDEWGFIAGSSLYGGFINGFNTGAGASQVNYYVGTTINTPIKNLRVGAAYDYVGQGSAAGNGYANVFGGYLSFQATEKLSIHGRAEYGWTDTMLLGGFRSYDFDEDGTPDATAAPGAGNHEIFALTGTLQYDLWQNVLSRIEFRWDHQAGDNAAHGFGNDVIDDAGTPDDTTDDSLTRFAHKRNHFSITANVIYKF
jgi:hypothetical protein